MDYEKGKSYPLIGSAIIVALIALVSLANSCPGRNKINRLEKQANSEVNFSLPSDKLKQVNEEIKYMNDKDFYLELYTKPYNQNVNSLLMLNK